MEIIARLAADESLGDGVMKVDYARELVPSTFTERSDFAKLVRPYLRSAMADVDGQFIRGSEFVREISSQNFMFELQ
jgi:hypothetical protein